MRDVPRLHGPDARQRRARRLPARLDDHARLQRSQQLYKPWSGRTIPSRVGRRPRQYYGYDAWWPNWVLGTGPSQDSRRTTTIVVALEADGPLQGRLVDRVPNGVWMFQSTASPSSSAGGCTRARARRIYALGGRGGAARARCTRPRQRSGLIIFLSDGAANTSPTEACRTRPLAQHGHAGETPMRRRRRGCGATRRRPGRIVYTIGYDLDAGAATPESAGKPNDRTATRTGATRSRSGLRRLHRDPGDGDATRTAPGTAACRTSTTSRIPASSTRSSRRSRSIFGVAVRGSSTTPPRT